VDKLAETVPPIPSTENWVRCY